MQAIINRLRPIGTQVRVLYHEQGMSFPGGYMILTMAFWGWLFIFGM